MILYHRSAPFIIPMPFIIPVPFIITDFNHRFLEKPTL